MKIEECYGAAPVDTDSELTEVAVRMGMSLQALKEYLRKNNLGIFRPGSVPIAEATDMSTDILQHVPLSTEDVKTILNSFTEPEKHSTDRGAW
jgi:hypothetical protein